MGQRYCGFCKLGFVYSCPRCRVEVGPEHNFCGACGTRLEWLVPPAQEELEDLGESSNNSHSEMRGTDLQENLPG